MENLLLPDQYNHWIKNGPKIDRNNSETLCFESKVLNEEEMSNLVFHTSLRLAIFNMTKRIILQSFKTSIPSFRKACFNLSKSRCESVTDSSSKYWCAH